MHAISHQIGVKPPLLDAVLQMLGHGKGVLGGSSLINDSKLSPLLMVNDSKCWYE